MTPGGYQDKPYDVFVAVEVAAGAYAADLNVRIVNPDSDFFLCGISGVRRTAGEGGANGVAKLLLKDQSGRALSNAPLFIQNLADGSGLATPLPGPYIQYGRNAVIRFDLQEVTGLLAGVLWLNFWGFKRFREGATC